MPLWFVLTSLSVLVLAVAEIAQKIAVTRKDDISAEANNTVVWFVQGLLALVYLLIFVRSPLPALDLILVLRLLVLGSVYFWAGTLFYTSYKTGSASVNSILLSSSIVVSTFLGITFFEESHSVMKFIGSLVVILAIVFLNYDKNVKLSKGNLLALAGAGLYGIAFTLDKSFAIQLSPHLYQVLFSFGIGLSGFIYRGKTIVKDLAKIEKNTLVAASVAALSF